MTYGMMIYTDLEIEGISLNSMINNWSPYTNGKHIQSTYIQNVETRLIASLRGGTGITCVGNYVWYGNLYRSWNRGNLLKFNDQQLITIHKWKNIQSPFTQNVETRLIASLRRGTGITCDAGITCDMVIYTDFKIGENPYGSPRYSKINATWRAVKRRWRG